MNHQSLLHPHVVQLKEVMCVPPYLAIVMEYVPGGDMFQYVVSRRGLPESEARWFFQQLILGMDYCHRKGEVLLGKIAVEGVFLGATELWRELLLGAERVNRPTCCMSFYVSERADFHAARMHITLAPIHTHHRRHEP